MEEKGENMRGKWLTPELDNQNKNWFPIFRLQGEMVSKNIVEAYGNLNFYQCFRSCIFSGKNDICSKEKLIWLMYKLMPSLFCTLLPLARSSTSKAMSANRACNKSRLWVAEAIAWRSYEENAQLTDSN